MWRFSSVYHHLHCRNWQNQSLSKYLIRFFNSTLSTFVCTLFFLPSRLIVNIFILCLLTVHQQCSIFTGWAEFLGENKLTKKAEHIIWEQEWLLKFSFFLKIRRQGGCSGLTGAAVSSYFFGSGAALGSRLLSLLTIKNTETCQLLHQDSRNAKSKNQDQGVFQSS